MVPNVEQHVGQALDTIGDHGVLGAILVLSLCLNGLLLWWIGRMSTSHTAKVESIQSDRVADAKAVADNHAKVIASSSQTAAAMATAFGSIERKIEQLVTSASVLPIGQATIAEAVGRCDGKLDRNGEKMDRLTEAVGRSFR